MKPMERLHLTNKQQMCDQTNEKRVSCKGRVDWCPAGAATAIQPVRVAYLTETILFHFNLPNLFACTFPKLYVCKQSSFETAKLLNCPL